MTGRQGIVDTKALFGCWAWRTRYNPGLEPKRHLFWAPDRHEARIIAWQLSMPEPERFGSVTYQNLAWDIPNAPRDLRKYIRSPRSIYLLSRAMHSMGHLAFLGMRCGRLSVEDALGDFGLVHGLAHLAQFHPWGRVPGWEIKSAVQRLTALTDRTAAVIPGYSPSRQPTKSSVSPMIALADTPLGA